MCVFFIQSVRLWYCGMSFSSDLLCCCESVICWVEGMSACMFQALQSVRLWYCGKCSDWLRSVELRVWVCVCFKPYSQFVCGIVACVLSGSDLLSWGYECVYVSSLTVSSSVVLRSTLCSVWLRSVELRVWVRVCFKPHSQFIFGIVECVLSGSDLLSWGYECVYVSSLTVSSSVVLWHVFCLAQICWVEGMSACMFQALQSVFLWYCGVHCVLSGSDLLCCCESAICWVEGMIACMFQALQSVCLWYCGVHCVLSGSDLLCCCESAICWVEGMSACMFQALQSVRLWYCGVHCVLTGSDLLSWGYECVYVSSLTVSSSVVLWQVFFLAQICLVAVRQKYVELRVWVRVCFKPYSQFVCGIVACVLSGSDLLSWGYECVYVSSLTVSSSVVLWHVLL